jgi:DNA/RNA-binding domain of Phe-tRNA-synthetase-like protein
MDELTVERGDDVAEVRLGVVHASGIAVGPSGAALAADIDRVIAAAEAGDALRGAVRDMLRFGRYKPTGRAKPASEYLVGAAREGRFPRINNLVDLNNLVSLESLLPCSIVDVARAGTRRFRLRRGRDGESYVFNTAGQAIELRDLLLVARLPDDAPCANPVKDAMATKVGDDTTEVAAFLYAPASLEARLRQATARFAAGLRDHVGPGDVRESIV